MQLTQQYTWKTKHHFPYTVVSIHMNENSSTKMKTIHMEAKFQPRIPSLTQKKVHCW